MQDSERGPVPPAGGLGTADMPHEDHGGGASAVPHDQTPGQADDGPIGALREEIGTIVDDARTYVEAEIAFQKTRARLAGKQAGKATLYLLLALVLLHIALIALAVGIVIALAPQLGIWGAIAVVVGVLLVGTFLLVRAARAQGDSLGAMFGRGETP